MKLTNSAANAILNIMKTKGLNPLEVYLEIGLFHGNLGIGFTKEKIGKLEKFGQLTVVIQSNIDTTDIVIDFGEVGDKKGLIFLGEKNDKIN